MKKIILAVLIGLAFSQVQAQVTFRPGVRAGVNFSHFTEGDSYNGVMLYDDVTNQYYRNRGPEFKSKTDFYVGIYGALKLTRFYTLQPELNYTRQGTKIEWSQYNTATHTYNNYDDQIDVSYVSVSLINKFTFNNFNLHIGPTIDVIVDKKNDGYGYYNTSPIDPAFGYDYYYDEYDTESDIDFAFVLGIGYNFTKNLGIEARVKKGIIPVYDFEDYHTNVVFSAGLNYTFDIK